MSFNVHDYRYIPRCNRFRAKLSEKMSWSEGNGFNMNGNGEKKKSIRVSHRTDSKGMEYEEKYDLWNLTSIPKAAQEEGLIYDIVDICM